MTNICMYKMINSKTKEKANDIRIHTSEGKVKETIYSKIPELESKRESKCKLLIIIM